MITGTLTIDYTMSLEEMINTGHYEHLRWFYNTNEVKDLILSKFTQLLSGIGKVDVEFKIFNFEPSRLPLFRTDRYISTEDILSQIRRDGYRPAKIEELLAYGAAFPEAQRESTIHALGSLIELPEKGVSLGARLLQTQWPGNPRVFWVDHHPLWVNARPYRYGNWYLGIKIKPKS